MEQIISTLRHAEVALSQGTTVEEFCRQQQITVQTYYRWRKEYGGVTMDQAKRMKEIEDENRRLRKAVSDLTIDNQILKEVSRGNF
jgi:transposase-like protein